MLFELVWVYSAFNQMILSRIFVMKMKFTEPIVRWIGIALVAIVAEAANTDHLATEPYWYQYMVALTFTAVYWNGACFFIFRFRRRFPEISKTGRRLLFSALGIIFWMTFGGIPIKIMYGICSIQDVFTYSEHAEFLPFNFVAAIVISLSYEAFYFFEKWKE